MYHVDDSIEILIVLLSFKLIIKINSKQYFTKINTYILSGWYRWASLLEEMYMNSDYLTDVMFSSYPKLPNPEICLS